MKKSYVALDGSKLNFGEQTAEGKIVKWSIRKILCYVGIITPEFVKITSNVSIKAMLADYAHNTSQNELLMRTPTGRQSIPWLERQRIVGLPNNQDRSLLRIGQKSIIALANTTPEFANYYHDPNKYIIEKNIARGEDVIMLERRSWIMASQRLIEPKEDTNRYRIGIIECLLYSLEAIISTTISIETFNEQMEILAKPVSQIFNENLSEENNCKRKKRDKEKTLKEFIRIISKARSISPCEDIVTSIEAHLKSSTSIRAVSAMKDALETKSLISLARERMKNYSYFLQTGHHIMMAEEQRRISWLLLMLTLISACAAAVVLFK